MITETRDNKRSILRLVPTIGSLCIIGIGLCVLLGWIFNIDLLKRMVPTWTFMAPNTAVILILLGFVLWILESKHTPGLFIRFAFTILWFALSFELLTLSEYIFGWNLGIDNVLFHDTVASYGAAYPGRLAPPTVICLTLLTLALMQFRSRLSWRMGIAVCFAFASCLFVGLQLLIYIYDASTLKFTSNFNQMAAHTAIAINIFSIGILLAKPSRRVIHFVLGNGVGIVMAHHALPVIILIPIIAGWLGFQVQTTDTANTIFVVALGVILTIGGLIILSGVSARLINRMEMALKRSEERYRLIVETAQEGVWMIDKETRTTFVNNALTEILGYVSEEMLGKPIFLFLDDESRSLVREALERRQNGIPERYDVRLQRKDGNYRWASVSASPMLAESGQYIGSVALISDITERKQIEAVERDQRALAEALRDTAEALVRSLDLDVVMANILANISRVVPHDACDIMLIKGDVAQVVYSQGWSAEDEAAIRAFSFSLDTNSLQKMIRTRAPMFIHNVTDDSNWIAFGTSITRSFIGAPIQIRGNVIGFICMISLQPEYYTTRHVEQLGAFGDQAAIAIENAQLYEKLRSYTQELEQRVNERTVELQRAKEHVEAILNSSSDGIILVSKKSGIRQANPAFDALFACSQNTYLSSPLTALVSDGDVPHLQEVFQATTHNIINRLEVHARRGDGGTFDAEIGLAPTRNSPEEAEMVVCVIRDITERKRTEEILAEERNLLRTVVDTLPDLIYVKDLQHRYVMLNKAANIGGQTAAGEPSFDLIGKTDFHIRPGPQAEQFFADDEKILQSGQPVKDYEELGALDKNWFLTTKVPLRNVNGQIIGLVGIGRDITERKQTEMMLANRNLALTALHAGILEIAGELDMSALLPHIMRRAVELLHADRGGGIYLYDHEANVLRLEAAAGINEGRQGMTIQPDKGVAGQVLQTGEPLIINDYARWEGRATVLVSDPPSAVMGVPLRIRGQVEGALLVFANSSERTFIEADQNLAEMFAAQAAAALHNARLYSAAQREISERKRTEEALRDSEAKYRQLVEDLRAGLSVIDVDARYTFVNDRFCELIGYTREEIIGSSAYNYVDNIGAQIIVNQLEQRQGGESSSYELTVRHKKGSLVFLLVSSSPLFAKNREYTGSLAVGTDITIRKQAEETLRQALATEKELGELKSRFVSMASHEFRTPLATILAFTESLSAYRDRLSDEQIDTKLGHIRGQIGYLTDIMDDVLLLARMQSRRLDFNPTGVNVDELCRSILNEFQNRPDIKHQLQYLCDEKLQEIMLDQKLMRQIISNLLSNAIKYSPADKPVQLSLRYTDEFCVFSVSDYGIGIPEADLKHLFEPFNRASNVGITAGTGLGLVIVKESVDLHGGTIEVETQLGVGTTFTVRIPIAFMGEYEDDKNSRN